MHYMQQFFGLICRKFSSMFSIADTGVSTSTGRFSSCTISASPLFECTLLDISDGGARLDVGTLNLPKTFILLLTPDADVRRFCGKHGAGAPRSA